MGSLANSESSPSLVCSVEVVESQSWRDLKEMYMWHFKTWFSGGLGSTRLMLKLDDLKGLFQPNTCIVSVLVR